MSGDQPKALYPPVSWKVIKLREGEAYGRKIPELENFVENCVLNLKFFLILTELTH